VSHHMGNVRLVGTTMLVFGLAGVGCVRLSGISESVPITMTRKPLRHATSGSPEDELIRAAFCLDVARVCKLVASGADVNAIFGRYDRDAFRDPWLLGHSSMGSERWTPLQAVASSNQCPDPSHVVENTTEALDAAREEMQAIPSEVIGNRDRRRVEIADVLLDAGADIDAMDTCGATALYDAVEGRYEKLALLLIRRGAQVNTRTGIYIDGDGDLTPLHIAASRTRILKALIGNGAKVDVHDTGGHTPLHIAVAIPNIESVRALLRAGAETNARNSQGESALHVAVFYEHVECVTALLEAGADPNALNARRETALDVVGDIPDEESYRKDGMWGEHNERQKRLAELLVKAGGVEGFDR
jgi:hypothetical protein